MGNHLAEIKRSPESCSEPIRDSLRQLVRNADAALLRGPYSVVDKEIVPPSGDKHDYLSFSRYWWPNPDTPDGLPYVRRDGEVNRSLLARGDRNRIGVFFDDIESLSLAAFLVDEHEYAPHAIRLLRVWFINPETRMNPNLNFGQGVPGKADGRGVGIIDTRHFIRVLESVALLNEIGKLSDADRQALREWFCDYLEWLTTSDLGAQERSAKNNHGTWYAAQVAYIALFVEKPDLAREIVTEVRDKRIGESFQLDGSQQNELTRTRSLHYSLFNLSALFVVARPGRALGYRLMAPRIGEGCEPSCGPRLFGPLLAKYRTVALRGDGRICNHGSYRTDTLLGTH